MSEDAIVRKFYPVALGNYAHKDYIKDKFPLAGPRGEGLTWIGAPKGTPTTWIKESPFPNARILHHVADPILHRQMAENQMGMTRLSAFMAEASPILQLLPGCALEPGPTLTLIIHPEMRKTVRVRRFVDFLVEALNHLRPQIAGPFG